MKNILLIGLGRFGKHVAYQLNELGHEVMAVDENENLVNEILPYASICSRKHMRLPTL